MVTLQELNMKYCFFLYLCYTACFVYAQQSSGGGTFPAYKQHNILKVEEYRYTFKESPVNDSLPVRTLEFDKSGRMVREEFTQRRSSPYYTYTYNPEGFLIDIDTTGLFGYGSFVSDRLMDTLFKHKIVEETSFYIDTFKLVASRKTTHIEDSVSYRTDFSYNTLGQLVMERTFLQDKSGKFVCIRSDQREYNTMGLLMRIIHRDEQEDEVNEVEEFKYFK
jgi:hypothetical protein